MRVKLCGFTRLDQVQEAARLPVEALGFICAPASPRYVPPRTLGRLAQAAGPLLVKVGVFVNEDPARLTRIYRESGLNLAQLHGDEDLPYLERLTGEGVNWLKAIRVANSRDLHLIARLGLSHVLLDAKSSRAQGGTGERFDWSLAQQAAQQAQVILAGGITPENAAQAVAQVQPYGLDLSSGIERSPGIKDFAKIQTLLRALGRL